MTAPPAASCRASSAASPATPVDVTEVAFAASPAPWALIGFRRGTAFGDRLNALDIGTSPHFCWGDPGGLGVPGPKARRGCRRSLLAPSFATVNLAQETAPPPRLWPARTSTSRTRLARRPEPVWPTRLALSRRAPPALLKLRVRPRKADLHTPSAAPPKAPEGELSETADEGLRCPCRDLRRMIQDPFGELLGWMSLWGRK